MPKEQPDHHDAEILLRVYELRREAVLRASRDGLSRDFWPKSYADVQAAMKSDHPLNAAYRQVATYWEMVYGLVKWSVVHPGLFLETNGEGLLLFAKVAPYLAEIRRDGNPASFRNAEWVAKETAEGRRLFELFEARVKKILETK